jgi:hypothetical protein
MVTASSLHERGLICNQAKAIIIKKKVRKVKRV